MAISNNSDLCIIAFVSRFDCLHTEFVRVPMYQIFYHFHQIATGMIEIAINGRRRCSVEIIIAINENWQTSSENGKGNIVQRKATASYHGHREQSRSEKNNVLIALFLSSLFISFYFP